MSDTLEKLPPWAQEKIARLERELQELQFKMDSKYWDSVAAENKKLKSQLNEAQKDLEDIGTVGYLHGAADLKEAKRDTKRLDWLDGQCEPIMLMSREDIDAAIDAAMKNETHET